MKLTFVNGFALGVALTAAFFALRLQARNDREMESWIRGRVKTLYALGYDLAAVRAHLGKILMTTLLAGAALSFIMIGVTAQQPKPQKAEIPLRTKLWCGSQSWLADPNPDGSLQYHFIGEWTPRQKIDFVSRCDPYNRSIPQRFAHAQQPQSLKLNPEASKAMLELFQAIETENAHHDAVLKDIDSREVLILKGAGISQSEWDRKMKPDDDGIIVFQPRPVASPKGKKEQ